MGSVIKKRRKRMAKKKHRKLLKKTRVQRRNSEVASRPAADGAWPVGRARHRCRHVTSGGGSRVGSPRDPAVSRVIGVDVVPPRGDIGGVSFVRADIRNPVIAKVIASVGRRHRRAHERDRDAAAAPAAGRR